MKTLLTFLIAFLSTSCTQKNVEEFAFRKTMEFSLLEMCEDDEACKDAVKSQIKGCLDSSNWRTVIEEQEGEAELERFVSEFYACFVDSDGNPHFEIEGEVSQPSSYN